MIILRHLYVCVHLHLPEKNHFHNVVYNIEGCIFFSLLFWVQTRKSKLPGNDREKEIKINIRNKFSVLLRVRCTLKSKSLRTENDDVLYIKCQWVHFTFPTSQRKLIVFYMRCLCAFMYSGIYIVCVALRNEWFRISKELRPN